MKLSEAEVNKRYRVKNMYRLGYGVRTRINDMGLVGCIFKVIIKIEHGPILIEVRGTRLALGKGLAEKVNVEEI